MHSRWRWIGLLSRSGRRRRRGGGGPGAPRRLVLHKSRRRDPAAAGLAHNVTVGHGQGGGGSGTVGHISSGAAVHVLLLPPGLRGGQAAAGLERALREQRCQRVGSRRLLRLLRPLPRLRGRRAAAAVLQGVQGRVQGGDRGVGRAQGAQGGEEGLRVGRVESRSRGDSACTAKCAPPPPTRLTFRAATGFPASSWWRAASTSARAWTISSMVGGHAGTLLESETWEARLFFFARTLQTHAALSRRSG